MVNSSSLVVKRVLNASRERVFAAWTQADLIKRWFCPGDLTVPVAELDARRGGAYRIVMQEKKGETHSPSGTYEQVVPNEKLVFTWKWAGFDLVTRVTVELRALSDEQTELTLTHEGFPDVEQRDLHLDGWNGCLEKLPLTL